MMNQDEFLGLFAPEPEIPPPSPAPAWKVLVVDDEPDIHAVVGLALQGMEACGRRLEILDANSAAEARQWLVALPDIALILLDVVMETEQAGLDLVRYVREDLGRHSVQIILLTGQPGYAPQREVIARHEIDGYRLKSELTADKIYFSVLTSLRTHSAMGQRDQALAEERKAHEALELQRDALASANTELEARIEERTAVLNLRNRELESDRKALASLLEKIEQAERQLLQSDKMATIGQLAAGVAHEINNPIGFVSSNLGTLTTYVEQLFILMAAHETGDPRCIEAATQHADLAFLREDLPALLRESQEGLDRVRKIVADLKGFSRTNELGFQEADLNAALDSTLSMVWNEIKYKAELVQDLGRIPLVPCVPSQIQQVFMNILVNAAQAIVKYGRITLRSREEGDFVWFEIEDTGKGMPEEVCRRVFEPFFTTKPVGQGTGLGMSISHDIIVKRHGGRLEVSSEEGKGTLFRIGLPKVRTIA